MRTLPHAFAFASVSLLIAAASASARPNYVYDIPNGTLFDTRGCVNCHFNSNGSGPRNAFGIAYDDSGYNYESICGDDSDGDGQTNGEELGDPLCEWTFGEIPARTDDVSVPGSAASTSINPQGVDPPPPPPPVGEGEGEGEGEPIGEG